MIQVTLNGVGEPRPTLVQAATQAATIELFAQWQTYNNGVHMNWDTFRSIDFRAIAVAALTGAGFELKSVEATLKLPTLDEHEAMTPKLDELLRSNPFSVTDEDPLGRTVTDGRVPSRPYGLSAADVVAHGEQVNG